MRRYTFDEVARELDVPREDVFLVAEAQVGLDHYDPGEETVDEEGRHQLITHFMGGEDPA